LFSNPPRYKSMQNNQRSVTLKTYRPEVETSNPDALSCGVQETASTCPGAGKHSLVDILKRANQIASLNDQQALLDRNLDLMMEITHSEVGVLYLLDEEVGELVFKVVKGCVEDNRLSNTRINCQFGAAGSAVQEARSLVSPDLTSDRLWYPELVSASNSPLANAITLPLLLRGQPIGIVQLFNYKEIDLEILQLLADRLAIDFEKIGLFESVQQRNNLLLSLIEAMQRIYTTLDREQLLQSVTEETARLLQVDKSSIFLTNAVTGDLEYQISFRQENETAQPSRPSEHKRPVRKDGAPDGQATQAQPRQGLTKQQHFGFVTRTAITVPLVELLKSSISNHELEEEHVIGGLMALNKKSGSFTSDDAQILEIIANQVSALLRISSLSEESNQLYIETIKALAAAIDAKDPYTQGHSLRVSELSVAIATRLGLSAQEMHDVLIGSLVHDIGKIGIPDHLLNKPERLTSVEFDVIKKHPLVGKRIIGEVKSSQDSQLAIIDHHERLDGSGYPSGLKGSQISLIGRIVAVADVYDAMTSDRPYRKALDKESVLQYLKENAGKLFDADCVEALVKVVCEE
jgi:HD-GYP domain-containing protein (c-di-GMP phosphodiesterase class II)